MLACRSTSSPRMWRARTRSFGLTKAALRFRISFTLSGSATELPSRARFNKGAPTLSTGPRA